MKSQTEAAMLTDDDWGQSEICQLDHLSSINSSWYKELELRKVLPFAKWTRQLETGACPVAGNFEVDCSENILGVAKISMGCVLAWLKSKSHRHFPNIYVSSPLIAQFEWTAFDAPKYRGLIAVGGKKRGKIGYRTPFKDSFCHKPLKNDVFALRHYTSVVICCWTLYLI